MIKNWQSQFEKLFDSSTEILNLQEQKKQYEALNQPQLIENLSYMWPQINTREQSQGLLSSLNNHFEVVARLNSQGAMGRSIFEEIYAYGIELPTSKISKDIRLPQISPQTFVTTPAFRFLKKFDLEYLVDREKSQGFLIQLNSKNSIFIATETAEPWLKIKLESTQQMFWRVNYEL